MAKCGFCNSTNISSTRTSKSGQYVILIICGSCKAVLGAVGERD